MDTVKRYGLEDLRTPVFIFERLCSIIYPVSHKDLHSFSSLVGVGGSDGEEEEEGGFNEHSDGDC